MTGFRRVYIVGVICFLMVNLVEYWIKLNKYGQLF